MIQSGLWDAFYLFLDQMVVVKHTELGFDQSQMFIFSNKYSKQNSKNPKLFLAIGLNSEVEKRLEMWS